MACFLRILECTVGHLIRLVGKLISCQHACVIGLLTGHAQGLVGGH